MFLCLSKYILHSRFPMLVYESIVFSALKIPISFVIDGFPLLFQFTRQKYKGFVFL
jgi:hypothetical protein